MCSVNGHHAGFKSPGKKSTYSIYIKSLSINTEYYFHVCGNESRPVCVPLLKPTTARSIIT